MATFRRRGDNWQVQIRSAGVKPFSKTFKTKAAGQQWARVQETMIDSNDHRNLDIGKEAFISEVVDKWIIEEIPNYKESGRRTYEGRANTIRKTFGLFKLHKLSADRIVQFAEGRLEHGLSSDTVRVLDMVYTASELLWKLKVPNNPVTEAKKIIKKKRILDPSVKRERRLKKGELINLMSVEHANDTTIDYLALFVHETGMRRAELSRLKKSDVSKDRKSIKIRESKTDWVTGIKGRDVPLSDLALQIIDLMPDDTNTLFELKPNSITQAFARLCESANITGLRLHDLRHECISRWFEMGFTITEVSSMSGNTDWKSLARYTHHKASSLAEKLRA